MAKEKIVTGTIEGNKKGFAFLIRDDKARDVFIPNRRLNGAIHGDHVSVAVYENEGEVVKVLKRGILSLIGTFYRQNGVSYVIPDNPNYFKDILINTPKKQISHIHQGSKVVVSISESLRNKHIYGTITEVLGETDDPSVVELCILRSKGFNSSFPQRVEDEAQKIVYEPQQNRTDLRDLLTITIDGEDAKDFDDAISVIQNDNDTFTLYVHIADVSHYVKKGGVIDVEAFERTTSVYFPSSVYPMLPKSISDGVCSLRPNEDKLAITVVMDIDNNAEVISSKFLKSVIRSDYRMTYSDVTAIYNGDKKLISRYMPIVNMLNTARSLMEILEKKRASEGALAFVTREAKVTLDQNKEISSLEAYPYDISNAVIEQFMILTNTTVAKYLTQKGFPCIFRIHAAPELEKLEDFLSVINVLGIKFDVYSSRTLPSEFNKILQAVKGEPIEPVINKLLLSAMQKAKYSTSNLGHFGLSLEYYCHFTSPIRRYPDLAVHRVLKAIIDNDDTAKSDKFLSYMDKAAANSSLKEIDAEKAEREVDDYYKALYMSKRTEESFDGIVSGMTQNGIFVTLDNTVEGFIHINRLPHDRYQLNSGRFKLQGIRNCYTIGDRIKIKVYRVNVEARMIDFSII